MGGGGGIISRWRNKVQGRNNSSSEKVSWAVVLGQRKQVTNNHIHSTLNGYNCFREQCKEGEIVEGRGKEIHYFIEIVLGKLS